MTNYRFFNGPWDGKLVKLNEPEPYFEVPVPLKHVVVNFSEIDYLKPTYTKVLYEAHKIVYQEFHFIEPKTHYIYVQQGTKIGFG